MPSAYTAPSIYDSPELLFSMIWDGEFTARGAYSALTNPAALSPQERDTLSERMKAASGGNGAVNTLIDVALNPWTWVFFATMPMSPLSVLGGKGGLFEVAPQFSAWVSEKVPFLMQLGSLTGTQILRGTDGAAVARQVARGVEQMAEQEGRIIGNAMEAMLKKAGIRSLDYNAPSMRGAEKATAERLSYAIYGHRAGWDRDHVERVFKGMKNGMAQFEEKVVPRWVPTDLRGEVRKIAGAEGERFLDSLDEAFKQRHISIAGVDGAAEFVPNPEKILRLYRGMRNSVVQGSVEGTAPTLVKEILGEDLASQLRTAADEGGLTADQFYKIVSDTYRGGLGTAYMPRNTIKVVGQGGKMIPPSRLQDIATSKAMASADATFARTRAGGNFWWEDLSKAADMFGATPEFRSAINQARGSVEAHIREGNPVKVLAVDAQNAIHRYFSDTARSYAWHIQQIGEEVLAEQRAYLPYASDEGLEGIPKFFTESVSGKRASILKSMDDIAPDEVPLGGFSLADAAWRTHALMRNPYAKTAFARVIIPGVSGKLGIEKAGTVSALVTAKQATGAFLDTSVAKAIKEQGGGFGSDFIDRLKQFANPEVPPDVLKEQAGGMTQAVSKWLYSSHLGLNLNSVIANLTQPFLLASSWVGVQNVVRGYAEAFKEMGEYAAARVSRYGFRAISPAERRELMSTAFKDMELSGIAPDVYETFDSLLSQGGRSFQKPRGWQQALDWTLKPFEKAEWLNRTVAVKAVQNAYRTRGINDPVRMAIDARTLVEETQFGSDTLTTPLAFMTGDPALTYTGRVLNNPLMRQFLTFPLRSATALAYTAPRLAGREGVRSLTGVAGDFARGMGISAILHEVVKNTLGGSLDRSLFFSSATDLLGGERLMQDGNSWVPVPPVIDIPVQVTRGLLTGDKELLGQSFSRMVPGGIAVSRALGVSPAMLPQINPLQKTYVNWQQPAEDGRVPVYGSDGSLISYESPSTVVMRGLGVDLGKFTEPGALDQFLLKNREAILEYRRRYLRATVANAPAKAASIAAEYERRYGVKLTVTRQQVEQFQRMRTVPRTTRILERMPGDLRDQYTSIVQQARGQDPSAFSGRPMAQETARAAGQAGLFPSAPREAGQPTGYEPYTPYRPY